MIWTATSQSSISSSHKLNQFYYFTPICHLAPPAHPLPLLCLTADQEQEQAEEEALALAGGKIGSPVHGQKKESHEGNSGIKLNNFQSYKSIKV